MRIVLAFLSRLPVGQIESQDFMADLGKAAGLFPVAGLILGLVNLAVFAGSRWLFGPATTAVITIGTYLWLTGFVHLDGLMDTADGVLSHRSRARMLEIMKDSRVGVMGATVGALSLLLRFALLIETPMAWLPVALVLAPTLGRMAIIHAASNWPPPKGAAGSGASFSQHLERKGLRTGLIIGLLVAVAAPVILTGLSTGLGWVPRGLTAWVVIRAMIVWVATLGLSYGVGRWLAAQLGGLTGDTFGALNELTELVVLAIFAAQPGGWG